MSEVGGEESKFSHLSSEQREILAKQGREFVSRLRQKQLRGVKESADWTAAVQSEVEKRLGELNESHAREIEDIRAKGEFRYHISPIVKGVLSGTIFVL